MHVEDQDGRQALLWAASGETLPSKTYCATASSDAILELVNAGADVHASDKDGLTGELLLCLGLACSHLISAHLESPLFAVPSCSLFPERARATPALNDPFLEVRAEVSLPSSSMTSMNVSSFLKLDVDYSTSLRRKPRTSGMR